MKLKIEKVEAIPITSPYGGFTYLDIDNRVRNEVETLPGFGGGQVFDWSSIYESQTNHLYGGIRIDTNSYLTLGFDTVIYANSGTFELDKKTYSLYALIKSAAGYTLRFGYEREDYNEEAVNFDDYDANIFTVGVGYDFGS